jgi:hypothetical protein
MGSWGYMPREGDSPCDMESFVAYEAIAPYLLKLFRKPLPKGSRTVVRKGLVREKLSEAGVIHPARRLPRVRPRKTAAEKRAGTIKRVSRAQITAWTKAHRRVTKAILEEGEPGTLVQINDASWEMWNRLGLVQILSEKNHGIPVSVVKKCRSYLKKLAKDEGFAETWRDPESFRKSVADMLEYVEDTIADDMALRRRLRSSARGRRGPRLIHDPLFRDVPGQRKRARAADLFKRKPKRRRRRRRKAAKKAS